MWGPSRRRLFFAGPITLPSQVIRQAGRACRSQSMPAAVAADRMRVTSFVTGKPHGPSPINISSAYPPSTYPDPSLMIGP
jgi:hypothetical protein